MDIRFALSVFVLSCSPALGAIPPMPGMTSGLGAVGNGMVHVEVAVQNNAVSAHLRYMGGADASGVRLTAMLGGPYDDPYGVLEGVAFNAQYGWLEDQSIGFTPIDIALDEFIAIELLGVDGPGAVAIFEGGTGMEMNGAGHTMAPIHETDGSSAVWMWDDGFAMQHNWYTFSAPGDYDLSFRVYVADSEGVAVNGYSDAGITLGFTVVPEPASGVLLLPLLALTRRSR